MGKNYFISSFFPRGEGYNIAGFPGGSYCGRKTSLQHRYVKSDPILEVYNSG